MGLPNVGGMVAVDSVSKLLRGLVSLFRCHAYVPQNVPFFCLPKIVGFFKNSLHSSAFLLADYLVPLFARLTRKRGKPFIIEQMKNTLLQASQDLRTEGLRIAAFLKR